MNGLRFELCAETVEAARAAEAEGADQIELCSGLRIGGVTPSLALIEAAVRAISIPVRVLIRPRGGDFCYTTDEFDLMRQQIEEAKQTGAAGVAVGVLLRNGHIDVARSRELVELARPMGTTFHRAFDETVHLDDALEDVIATGADCLLTSGGEADVLTGAKAIARLRKLAGRRLDIMAGGGLRLANLTAVVRLTGVTSLHGSLTRNDSGAGPFALHSEDRAAVHRSALRADIREAIRLFHEASNARRDSEPVAD